jgi:uncharacterized protein YxeA
MKKIIATVAGLVLASAAFAAVNPTRPMVTGRGNVNVRPAKVIVTNQTAAASDETVKLENFVVTGSLLKHPVAKPVRRK